MPSTDPRQAWERLARAVARRVNLGWWLERLAAPLLIAGLLGAFALLFLRREHPATPVLTLLLGIAAALALLSGLVWLLARTRFESPEDSMVRIEANMKLRNALSAARAGVAPWPAPPARVDAGLDWNWKRVLVAPLAALAFLAAALLIPVSALPGPDSSAKEEPLAWQQLESDLDRLEEDELAEEDYLEEIRKKLEELKSQDEEEWFSHASLEATDSLKEQHRTELERVERGLSRTDRALGSLQKNAGAMAREKREGLMQQFDQALQGLQNGAMKPNRELLEQLQQLDPGQLGQLDAEQLQQLRQNLRNAAEAMREMNGGQGGEGGQGDEWLDELLDGQDQQGQGNCPGGNCPGCPDCQGNQPGKGGINRGPGHAPGVLGREGDQLATGDLEKLEAKDLSRTLPGDLLELQDGEHEIDESPSRVREGGAVASRGEGGDRVWKDSLDPDEQRTLKRFFE